MGKSESKKSEWGLINKLLIGIFVGVVVGLVANIQVMSVVGSIKHILGQFIFFSIPSGYFGFIAPAITRLRQNANKMLGAGITIAYLSAVGAR